jgi:hypothetical protein
MCVCEKEREREEGEGGGFMDLLDRHAGFEHRRGGAAVTTHPAFVAAAETVIARPFLVTVFPAYLLVKVSKSIGESCYTPYATG